MSMIAMITGFFHRQTAYEAGFSVKFIIQIQQLITLIHIN